MPYCSKECQKASWQAHKSFCYLVQSKGAPNAFLTAAGAAKNEDYVYDLVIDSYRITVQHDHLYRDEDHGGWFRGKELPEDNVFANGDIETDFQNYLDCAETAGVLPVWWDFYSRLSCLGRGIDDGNQQNVFIPIEEGSLIPRYDNNKQVRSILIFLAELIVGYERTGPPSDGEWIKGFREHVYQPEVRRALEEDSLSKLKATFDKHGRPFPPTSDTRP